MENVGEVPAQVFPRVLMPSGVDDKLLISFFVVTKSRIVSTAYLRTEKTSADPIKPDLS